MKPLTSSAVANLAGEIGLPGYRWFALAVRSRSEETVSGLLAGKGYEVLFPSRTEEKKLCDRVKSVQKAIFSGYTFCRFDASERLPILTTPGVLSIVGSGGKPIPVSDVEIESLFLAMISGREIEESSYIRTGQKVEIRKGPLRGAQGIVTLESVTKLIISVDLLGRSVAVSLDPADLRAA